MFKERIIEVKEDLKNHIKRNKNKYYVCGLVGVAGVTFVVTRRIYTPKIIVWNSYPNGWKHLGRCYVVRCDQNQRLYFSQESAAKALKIDKSSLSRHLNKDPRYKQVGGYTFKRTGMLI